MAPEVIGWLWKTLDDLGNLAAREGLRQIQLVILRHEIT